MASEHIKKLRRSTLCSILVLLNLFVSNCFAVQVEFQLSGPNSITAAPYLNFLGVPLTGQDSGNTSLTTTYSGTVTVDVNDLMNPTSIAFVSANAIAANSGNWLPEVGGGNEGDPEIEGDANPGTPAPANYGFYYDAGVVGQLYAASRDSVWSLNATSRAVAGGQFDPLGIEVELASGTYDVSISSFVYDDDASSDDLSGAIADNCTNLEGTVNRCGANMGSYSVANDLITLMLPLDFIMAEGADTEVAFTGTLTATYSLEQPLLGDYNDDLKVDAADYVLWRDLVGSSVTLPNDDIGGMIGMDHYEQWANHFGGVSSGGIGSASVPEPTSSTLALLGFVGLWVRRRATGTQLTSAKWKRCRWNC